jgi:hypothetical protein
MKALNSILTAIVLSSISSYAGEINTNNFLAARFQEPSKNYQMNIDTNNFLRARPVLPKDIERYPLIYAPQTLVIEKGVTYSSQR